MGEEQIASRPGEGAARGNEQQRLDDRLSAAISGQEVVKEQGCHGSHEQAQG
jgi:hypothetical protein